MDVVDVVWGLSHSQVRVPVAAHGTDEPQGAPEGWCNCGCCSPTNVGKCPLSMKIASEYDQLFVINYLLQVNNYS